MTQQSIATCLILSTLSGMMGVLATATLAHSEAQKQKGDEWFTCFGISPFFLSIAFQIGIAVFNITASWFGPVALVVPTAASAQLLFNMVMFGVVLGLESFNKEMRVGAYVVVLAAVLLPVVGPGAQENQNIVMLMRQPSAVVWTGVILVTLGMSAIGLTLSTTRKNRHDGGDHLVGMFAYNLIAQTTGAVVGTTAAKMFVLVNGEALIICIALWLISSLILVYATVLQATTVSQAKFVPLSVGTKIAVNAITGIIIWEDWRVIESWVGYICVFLYLMLGNYLLCDVDLFGAKKVRYNKLTELARVHSV